MERVQKLMAQAGLGSRRRCEQLIRDGRVKLNGRIVTLGTKADSDRDVIEVDGRPLIFRRPIYIKLNKPKGVLSSTTDELEKGRPTIRDLVDIPGHIYPIGRLDKQSEGLIILTNDGPLTNKLTHPRYGHEKVYEVWLGGNIPESSLAKWRAGMNLDGKKTAPAQIKVIERDDNYCMLQITMREGRKRQIRRIAAMLDHPVTRLVRKRIGPIELGNLKTGEWCHLSDPEIAALKAMVEK